MLHCEANLACAHAAEELAISKGTSETKAHVTILMNGSFQELKVLLGSDGNSCSTAHIDGKEHQGPAETKKAKFCQKNAKQTQRIRNWFAMMIMLSCIVLAEVKAFSTTVL